VFVKVTEAAEEFVATQDLATAEVNWNNTQVLRAWYRLRDAVIEHQQEGVKDEEA
jgi:hypothetical protein